MRKVNPILIGYILISCSTFNQQKDEKPSLSQDLVIQNDLLQAEKSTQTKKEAIIYTPNVLGEGKLIFNYGNIICRDENYTIRFYDNYLDASIFNEVIIRWVSENGGYVKALNSDFIKVKDYYIDEPYYILYMNCLQRKDGFYQVITNEENGSTKWVKENSTIEFSPWPEFLKSVVCVKQIDHKSNPAYSQPSDFSEVLYNDEMCWEVVGIKDKWIEVKYSEFDMDMTNVENSKFRAWIRWRDETKLLIDYYLST